MGFYHLDTGKVYNADNLTKLGMADISYKEFQESVYTEEIGTGNRRNARPIVDINGKAFLWHRGYYNPNSYTDFNTEAKLYLMENPVRKVTVKTKKLTLGVGESFKLETSVSPKNDY